MSWIETIRALRKDYIKRTKDYVSYVMPKLDFNQTKQIKKTHLTLSLKFILIHILDI